MRRVVREGRREAALTERGQVPKELDLRAIVTPQKYSLLREVFGEMTPSQRARLARLAIEWRELKSEMLMLRDFSIAPFSLQSSLSPAVLDAAGVEPLPWGDEDE
jgi:hypothetical protein